MTTRKILDVAYLRNALAYNADQGTLTWCRRHDMRPQWNARFAGKPAFTWVNHNGYPSGRILDRGYLAHRVAWAIHYGEWPEDEIDHINGNPLDYKIANLRQASRSVNMRNAAKPITNTSGFVGVTWYKSYGKWLAQVNVGKKSIKLGYFACKDEAIAARLEANERFGFHENHGRERITCTP